MMKRTWPFGKASSPPASQPKRSALASLGLLVLTASNVVGDEPALVLDLLATAPVEGVLHRTYGSSGSGVKGTPVAGGHDCDGDGFIDSAYAGIQSSPLGRPGAGEVSLVFGNGMLGGTLNNTNFTPRILKIAGLDTNEVTGAEIWMDDVTGDGLGDLLIGRQNFSPSPTRRGAGALSVVVGSTHLRAHAATLAYLDLAAPPTTIVVKTISGVQAWDRFGIWMRTGDVDGDKIPDIVVGADEEDDTNLGENNRGAAYVIRGGSYLATTGDIDLARFNSTNTPLDVQGHVVRIRPPTGSGGYHLGATCQAVDLDGNGRAEVLAAAALTRSGAGLRLTDAPAGTGESSGGSARGTLYIAWDDNFPAGPWLPEANFDFDLSVSPGSRTIMHGDNLNDIFGEEILGGKDFDGDGHADLFLGDLKGDPTNVSPDRADAGIGHVFYHAKTLRDLEFSLHAPPLPTGVVFSLIYGPRQGAIGADTAVQGDFDGDGLYDLAIGNPHDHPQGRILAGTMHVLYGKPGGWPALIDLAPQLLPPAHVMRIARVEGARGSEAGDRGDTLCYSAACADINEDGLDDLIVNEMVGNGIEPGSIDVGNMLHIDGRALLPAEGLFYEFNQQPGAAAYVVKFASISNSTYTVQISTNLSIECWSNVVEDIIGDLKQTCVTVTVDGVSKMVGTRIVVTP